MDLDLELALDDQQEEVSVVDAAATVGAVEEDTTGTSAPDECTPTTDPPDEYPALQLGGYGPGLEEIKPQWLRYNHRLNPRKDVVTMVSDARKGLWKSICACVKGIKTIKEWKAQPICHAHIFVSGTTVKSINLHHECSNEHVGRKRNYNAKQLHLASQDLLKTLPNSSHKGCRSEAATEYMETAEKEGFSVGRGQAYKVISRLSKQPIEAQIGEFYFLQSLFQAWKRADPDGSYTLEKAPCAWKGAPMDQFQRYYMAPSISKHAWRHSQMHLFISDACETSSNWSSFQMSLLMAVTLDGNDQVVVLALALCDSDSELNWIWFLQNLMRDFAKLNVFLSSSPHVFGDHIPNLLDLMNAAPSRCVNSLISGLEKSLSLELTADEKKQIHQLARFASVQSYEHRLRRLSRNNPDVAAYLDAFKQEFATHCFLQSSTQAQHQSPHFPSLATRRQRFGEVMSNATELVHSQVQEILDQPVATMTISLLMKISELHLERKLQAQRWLDQGQLLSTHARYLHAEILQDAQTSCQVQVLGQDGNVWRAIVSQPPQQNGESSSFAVAVNTDSFQVDCSCQYSEEMGLPCVHATALLQDQNFSLAAEFKWFHPRYHTTTLLEMYGCDPPDFSVFGKMKVEELVPPEHFAIPSKKRRKTTNNATATTTVSAVGGTLHKCAACGELGHHPKTCHRPSTQYRYNQFFDTAMKWAKAALDLQV